jgi:hypothetical protein
MRTRLYAGGMIRRLRSPVAAAVLAALLVLAVVGADSVAQPVAHTAASVGKRVKKALKLAKRADKRSRNALKLAKRADKNAKAALAKGGPAGPAGRSALTTLRSGETVRGVIGVEAQATGSSQAFEAYASLPIPAPAPLVEPNILIDGAAEGANLCRGSNDAPSAPRGKVCVYATKSNVSSVSSQQLGSQRFGFAVHVTSTASGEISFKGAWAYTAP